MAGVPQMWGITQVTLGFCGSLFSHSDTVFCKAFDRLPGTYEIYTDTSSTEKIQYGRLSFIPMKYPIRIVRILAMNEFESDWLPMFQDIHGQSRSTPEISTSGLGVFLLDESGGSS